MLPECWLVLGVPQDPGPLSHTCWLMALETPGSHRILDHKPKEAVGCLMHPLGQSLAKLHAPKHLMPKPFDGIVNWSEFLVQCNVCAHLGQWTDLVKAHTTGGLMAGKALITICAIPEWDRASFTNLVSALTLNFQDRQYVARAKLDSRVHNVNEKFQNLASDIWNLACRAYPDFSLEYREQIRLEAFKRTIDVQLQLWLTDFKATPLNDAVKS